MSNQPNMDAQRVLSQAKLSQVQQPVYRNIVSLVVSEDLFSDLSDKPNDYQVAMQLEALHTPPHYTHAAPIINRPFEEADWFNTIDFPFKHWQSSRFSPGSFGVWYGASQLNTTIYETAYHWVKNTLREEDTLPIGRIIERKVYTLELNALLLDLRAMVPTCPMLVHSSDYTLTHQLGHIIHHQGHPGLISRSARCEGDVQAIFNSRVLASPKFNQSLRYEIAGQYVCATNPAGKLLLKIGLSELGF